MKKGIVTIILFGLSTWAQAADIKAGEEKAAICTACHGPAGVSVNPDWPSLAGQGQKYIEKQLKDFKSGERPNMVMQPQAAMLSDEDIVNVAAYFAAQTPGPASTEGAGENPEELLALGKAIYQGGDMSKNIPASLANTPNTAASSSMPSKPRR